MRALSPTQPTRPPTPACSFHPEHSLPIVLDVGCNNPRIVEDKFYLVSARANPRVPACKGAEGSAAEVETECTALRNCPTPSHPDTNNHSAVLPALDAPLVVRA